MRIIILCKNKYESQKKFKRENYNARQLVGNEKRKLRLN